MVLHGSEDALGKPQFFFFSGQYLRREEGVRGCPLRKIYIFFFLFFLKFVPVLLTTKPSGAGLKALVDCPLKEDLFLFAASLRATPKG